VFSAAFKAKVALATATPTSGCPVRRTLRALAVSSASYYRWRRAAASQQGVEGICEPPPEIEDGSRT